MALAEEVEAKAEHVAALEHSEGKCTRRVNSINIYIRLYDNAETPTDPCRDNLHCGSNDMDGIYV